MKPVVLSSPAHCTDILQQFWEDWNAGVDGGWRMEDEEHMEEKEMQKELGLLSLKRGGKGGDFFVAFSFLVGGFRKVEPALHVTYFCIHGFKAFFFYFFGSQQRNKQKAL